MKPVTDQISTSKGDIQLNRSLVVGGGVLVALGGLIGFAGMVLVSSAIISATRQWVDQMEQPPSELAGLGRVPPPNIPPPRGWVALMEPPPRAAARRRWEQTKAAASAGAAAWRNGPSDG